MVGGLQQGEYATGHRYDDVRLIGVRAIRQRGNAYSTNVGVPIAYDLKTREFFLFMMNGASHTLDADEIFVDATKRTRNQEYAFWVKGGTVVPAFPNAVCFYTSRALVDLVSDEALREEQQHARAGKENHDLTTVLSHGTEYVSSEAFSCDVMLYFGTRHGINDLKSRWCTLLLNAFDREWGNKVLGRPIDKDFVFGTIYTFMGALAMTQEQRDDILLRRFLVHGLDDENLVREIIVKQMGSSLEEVQAQLRGLEERLASNVQ